MSVSWLFPINAILIYFLYQCNSYVRKFGHFHLGCHSGIININGDKQCDLLKYRNTCIINSTLLSIFCCWFLLADMMVGDLDIVSIWQSRHLEHHLWVIENTKLDRVKRIWYLSHMRAAKVQASLCIRTVSPEPSLLAHTSSELRGTFRQKARSLAPLNGWACAVKICHDGMLEDTNSLDGAQLLKLSVRILCKCCTLPVSPVLLLVFFFYGKTKNNKYTFFSQCLHLNNFWPISISYFGNMFNWINISSGSDVVFWYAIDKNYHFYMPVCYFALSLPLT